MTNSMSFAGAIKTCFKKCFTISGRARRSEMWYFVLFGTLILTPLYMMASVAALQGNEEAVLAFYGIYVLAALALVVPDFTVRVRRLHDTGRSGWNLLWILLPVIGAIVLLIYFVQDSAPNTNKWGPNPKEDVTFAEANVQD